MRRNPVMRGALYMAIVAVYPNAATTREVYDNLTSHGFKVTRRTVERDLRALAEAGLIERRALLDRDWRAGFRWAARHLKHSTRTTANG